MSKKIEPNGKKIETTKKMQMGLLDPYFIKHGKRSINPARRTKKRRILIGFIDGLKEVEIIR